MIGDFRARMKRLGIAFVVLTCLATVAPAAEADGRRGHHRGDVHGSRRFEGRHHRHHHHHHHHGFNHHHGFRHRTFFVGPSPKSLNSGVSPWPSTS